MSIDYRALCADLLDEVTARPLILDRELIARARAALAEPVAEVVEPTDEELRELAAAEMDNSPNWEEPECSYEADDPFPYEAPGVAWVNFARAVLARWGHQPAPPAAEEPEVVEPTDEELLELTEDWSATTGPRHDLSGCPEVPLYSVFADEVVEFARAVLARYDHHFPDAKKMVSQPAQPVEKEVAELVTHLRRASDGASAMGWEQDSWVIARAAELLERQAAPVPVAWMYKGEPDFDGEKWRENWLVTLDQRLAKHGAKPDKPIPLFHTQIVSSPVPVSERLPGPGDCDENGDCWFDTGTNVGWMLCDKVFGLRHGSRWWLPFHALPLPSGEVE